MTTGFRLRFFELATVVKRLDHVARVGYRVWKSNRNVSLSALENVEDKGAEGAEGCLSKKCRLIYSSRRERPSRMGKSGGER